ncbi:hemolysin family protein [Candidatus Chloroploca mongolica]|uniref:hemolysin family protein n=1 Tax=Candidatus Chloroploca mongolica TaxID=2528176 RepID=UPI0020B2A83F|nr:hemolysin family protein [Candidatus Chloroploca mongolica]
MILLEDPGPSLLLVGIGLCLVLLAFTSAVDAAFTSISRHRLHTLLDQSSPRTHRTITHLLDDPYRFKTTILLLNISLTILATSLTLGVVGTSGLWATVAGLLGLLVVMLTMSEVVPKALATRNPAATARLLATPMSLLVLLLTPLIGLVSLPLRPLYRWLSGKESPATPLVTEEELRMLVNVGEEEGFIEHDEREMIESVFEFGDTLLREIMVPRVDIVGIELESSLEEALDMVSNSGHSRIPVYTETIDQIAGILYAKDLIPILRQGKLDQTIESVLRPAHFVPETMKVNALLEDLQHRKVHLAVIVDEYGGTAGLATIEDLIEQIVGEIQDEYDTEGPSVQPLADGSYLVNARVPIYDINELLDLNITSTAAERIGGLVYETLGRVPRVDDAIVLDELTVRVLAVKGIRAQKLQLIRSSPALDDMPHTSGMPNVAAPSQPGMPSSSTPGLAVAMSILNEGGKHDPG